VTNGLNLTLRDYLAHFYQISHIFSLTLDVDEVFRRVMDEVVAATGAERGFLLLRDTNGGLSIRAARAQGGTDIDALDAHYSTGVVNRVIADLKPVLTIDAREEPWLRERQSTLTLSLRSILCVPLQFRDETLGAIYVDNRMHRGAFTPDHLELLTALSHHSAVAIENARLFRGMHEQLAALRLLHELSADLSSSLDLQRVLTACLERVQAVLGTKAASILILDKDELVFQVALGEKASELKPFRVPITQGIAGWVARNAQGTFSNDAYRDQRFFGNIDKRSGFVTQMVMAAPLIVKNRVIGVVEVFNKPGGFADSDLDLLSTIAASAAPPSRSGPGGAGATCVVVTRRGRPASACIDTWSSAGSPATSSRRGWCPSGLAIGSRPTRATHASSRSCTRRGCSHRSRCRQRSSRRHGI